MAYAVNDENYAKIVNGISSYSVPLIDMFMFLYDEVDEGYVTLDDDMHDTLEDAHEKMQIALDQLQGADYSRILVYLTLPEEGDETFAFLNEMHTMAQKYYDGTILIPGESTSQYDLYKTFQIDNKVVNVVSILAVLVVLLFTFQSAGMPVLLILVIQGAIWINFAFPALQHNNLFFMSYLIVSSIQMGANIDYAIVISTWYSDLKTRMTPREALIKALDLSFPTVLTSGSILSAAGFLIGQITTEPSIVGIGQCLSRGTLISMFLVMFVLPQILVLGDRIVEKTSFQVKLPATPIASQRLSGTTFVNGRVRGRISGFVDAEIHGVVKGDISAIMSSGSYDLPEGSGQPPEAGASPENTPNTPPADSVTGKEGDAQ